MNDLPGCITVSQCLLFADDFKGLKEVSSQPDTIALQQDLDFVDNALRRRDRCRDPGVTIGADFNFRMH